MFNFLNWRHVVSFCTFGFLDGLIAGGASLLGGVLGNRASAKEAARNREFQDTLSREAHRREVADLRAAGLNPILSGLGGHGAQVPGGSMAQQSDVIGPAVQSALAAKRQRQEISNMMVNEDLTIEQRKTQEEATKATAEQARLHKASAAAAEALETKTRTETDRLGTAWDTDKLDYQVRAHEQKGRLDAAGNVSSTAMQYKRIFDAIMDSVGGLVNPLKGFGLGYGKKR